MRYKAKTKDCRLIVRAKASWGEEIDDKALDIFERIYLRGFLKPKRIKKNTIEYSGPVGNSLYERLKKPISKRDFLFVMEQIVVAVQKIHCNNLSMNMLVLDIHYVFINDITKELQFLYVPTVTANTNADIETFVESVVYSVVPVAEKDTEFVSRFVYFLKAQKTFNPDLVERYIAREDRSVVNTIKKQHAGQSGFMTSKQKDYYDHYDRSDSGAGDEPTGLLDEEEPTGLLSEDDEATGMLEEEEEEEEEATGYLDEEEATGLLVPEDEDGTALLVEDQNVQYPTLFRVLTEETISINKPVFRLGKERSYVDYFVTNNNAVSRSHADIITRGNRYYVIDLNSKNHTYINDQILAVQYETEIRDGDRLKLGNEEFVFHVPGATEQSSFCPQCNNAVRPGSLFCMHCGYKL